MDTIDERWVKKFRTVTIKMKDGTIVTGKLNIGEYPRVSDLFRSSADQYFVLADAEHRGSSGKVIIINKTEIVWVEPEES
jgi:small nuclear ribonucleoprotein (snRNP)-like protein